MTDRLVDLLVDAAATYRLTRLLTRDALLDGLRERVREREAPARRDVLRDSRRYGVEVGETGPLTYLLGCPWCSSIWVGAGVALARRSAPAVWGVAAAGLAASAATGWLSERE